MRTYCSSSFFSEISETVLRNSDAFSSLYSEDASCADMGTSFWKISGPDTSGSLGLKGIPFTKEAPVNLWKISMFNGQIWETDINIEMNFIFVDFIDV